MKDYLGNKDIPVLGLVLPADFEQRTASEDEIGLEGYFVHWINEAAEAETGLFFETQLSAIVEKPVHIHTEGNTVYPQKDSRGMAFLQSSTMVIVILLIGMTLAPHLMIEEKRTKTMDVILVSPASRGQMVLGKAFAGLFFCLLAIAVVFIFNTALIVHWEVAFLTAVAGALFAVAVGLLMGSLLANKQQMTFWTWVLFVPLIFPVFFSITTNLFPAGFLAVIQWLPTVAMSEAFRVSFSEVAPLSAYAPELMIILGYVAVLLVAVERIVRRETK